jgi:hypothetical protein
MRERIVVLLAIALALGGYLGKNSGAAIPAGARTVRVSARPVATAGLPVPPVREINYFEASKDFSNWIGRHGESRGIIRQPSAQHVSQGKTAMAVYWRLKRWGEMVLLESPHDWHRYRRFAFDVYCPGGGFVLEVRIGDFIEAADFAPRRSRFVVRRRVHRGWNRLSFSLRDIGTKVALEAGRKIIRLRVLGTEQLFYLDNMRLER